MDITDAHLSTNRISSRVAPARSAARIWRRVPSGLRLVQAAFNATPTSSTSLRGRTPLVQGFVVIFTHVPAHCGSHSRSVTTAASHGPVAFVVAGVFVGVSAFTIGLTFVAVDVQTSAFSRAPPSPPGHRGFCPGSYGSCLRKDPASLALRHHRG